MNRATRRKHSKRAKQKRLHIVHNVMGYTYHESKSDFIGYYDSALDFYGIEQVPWGRSPSGMLKKTFTYSHNDAWTTSHEIKEKRRVKRRSKKYCRDVLKHNPIDFEKNLKIDW